MGHRLSKITTRTGDAGETGLADGSRVAKDSARIAALGEVDELNSVIGVLLAEPLPAAVREALVDVQHDLFDLGGEMAIPGHALVTPAQVDRLEKLTERFNADLAPLKEFILPGGSRPAALAHLARTVCRRAERAVVALATLGAGHRPRGLDRRGNGRAAHGEEDLRGARRQCRRGARGHHHPRRFVQGS